MLTQSRCGPRWSALVILLPLLLIGAVPASATPFCIPCGCLWTWFFGGVALTSMRQPPEPSDDPGRERPICTDVGLVKMRLLPEFTEAPADFEPGDTFKVDVFADINVELTSYGFHLVYDQELLKLESFTAAPPYRALPTQGGRIAAITWPTSVVGDDVLLGTAVFRAMGPEDVTASISAAYDVTDPTEGFAQRTCGFAGVEVTPTQFRVPEPAALMLLGLGFFLARRR